MPDKAKSSREDLERLLHDARRRQELIADFAKDALQNVELERLLHEATVRVSQGVKVDHVKVLRYEPDTADLLVVAGVGWKAGVVGRARLRIDLASPPGRALQTGQPVLIDDLPNDPEFYRSDLLAEHEILSVLNTPIFVNGVIWGVLEADSNAPGALTRYDAEFLDIVARILGSAIQRKQVEQEVAEASARNAALATDREVLLREMQHRLKNNLQMILALISMQQRKVTDPDAKRGFRHVAERVAAIALAQDQLSTRSSLGEVKLGAYLRALCSYIDPGLDRIVITADAQDLELPTDQAVPAGLIVNEAVANALKHAFPDGRAGAIRVSFEADRALGSAALRIADNGKGLGPRRPGGSGRDLISALAAQISGDLQYLETESGGTTVQVRFPLRLAHAEGEPGPPVLSSTPTPTRPS